MMTAGICISVLSVLVCVDMGAKQFIEDSFSEGEERKTCIPGLFLRKVYNKGFALNLLDGYPAFVRKASLGAGAAVLVQDIVFFLKKGRKLYKAGLLLITAGTVSNLYDRFVRGKVIDYIGLKCRKGYLLKGITANLADLYIAAGMLLTVISKIFHPKKKK